MTTLAQARDRDRAQPVYLMEIALLGGGPTLFFSDRNITVGAQHYEDYLEDLSGLGEALRRSSPAGLDGQVELRLKNDRFRSHDRLVEMGESYPFQGAQCVVREVYLDDGGAPSEAEALFKGTLGEPRDIGLMGFRCFLSDMKYYADRRF